MDLLYSSSMLLVSLSSAFFAFVIFLRGKNKKVKFYAILLLGTIFMWSLGRAGMNLSVQKPVSLFWVRFSYTGSIWMALAFLTFSWAVLDKKFNKIITVPVGLISLILWFLNFTNYFIKDLQPKLSFRFYDVPGGMAFEIFSAIYAIVLLYAHYELLNGYFRTTGNRKNQIGYLLLASLVGFIPSATTFPLVYNVPIYPFGVPIIALYPLILTYAITKHRLMDITVVIGRTSAFALVTLAYLGAFVGLWSALIYFHVPQVILLMITLIYLVFTGITFRYAWVATQTTADKTFIKGWYDYRVVQRKISESLRKITEKEELLPAVRKILDEELEIREVQIDFQEGKTNLLPPSLIEEIKHTKNIIPLPKESILPQGVVIPCFSNERLEALILVGPKRTEIPFNEVDMDLFRTLADEVYVVLQRVKPLEKAKADLAVEKVKLEIAQRELERTHRLASLGTLAAGLAHEIRNPMMALSSQAELLPKKLKDEGFLLWFSKMVPEQIFRILNIANRMLKFAKAKEEGLVKVNINKILEDILAMIEGKIRDKSIEVVKEFKTDKTISGNPDALSEAFLNIIINGIDFMDRGGTLTLITKEENTNLVVVIKDTGVGIPEDKLEHIFDPFYTSRAEGTGLGLSISYKIIKEHHGTIEVKSKVGVGTEVTVILPTSPQATLP
jgi:signal transduction histidine kinase